MKAIFLKLTTLMLVMSTSALATTAEEKFEREVSDTFFSGRSISSWKVDEFYQKVKEAQEDNFKLLVNYYTALSGKSESKAREKAQNKSSNVAYERMSELISLMRTVPEREAKEIARVVLDIAFALKTEGRDELYEHELDTVRGIIRPYRVKKKNDDDEEPSNLIDPQTGRVFGQYELMDLKRRGVDISKFDPKNDGQLWTKHDIKNYQVKSTYLPNSNLYKGTTIAFPSDGATVTFDDIKRSQNRPKFTVKTRVNGQKKKFKVKINLEIHGEPTAASLYAALGFNTDATKYVRDLKVRFKGNEKREFLRDFKTYFQMFDIRKSVKSEGRDSEGEYMIFKNALLEARDDELLRVGPWGLCDRL